jgi:hypothetical protein
MKLNWKFPSTPSLVIAVVILLVSFVSLSIGYDRGYKQGQLNAIRGEWTYFVIDGQILKYIGQEPKEVK